MITSLCPRKVAVELVLRIPGPWQSLQDLQDSLPFSVRLEEEHLVLQDGTASKVQIHPMDTTLLNFFASSCRRASSPAELCKIKNAPTYLNVIGSGGSIMAARQMSAVGAALIRGGGLGVFVDNSGRVHLGSDWVELADNAEDIEALVYAWISLIYAERRLRSLGMQVLGHADIVMKGKRQPFQENVLLSLLGCIADGSMAFEESCFYMEPKIGAYKISARQIDPLRRKSSMHNPHGVWVLTHVRGT